MNGYDIINISKRKIDKLKISEELEKILSAEEIKLQMSEALKSGGKVYAIKKNKKIYGCYIFKKEKREAEEFMKNSSIEKYKNKKIYVYELSAEYFVYEIDCFSEKIKKKILSQMKENAFLNECKAIIWNDDCYIAEISKGGKNYSGFAMGLSLGIVYGLMFKNIILGICFGIAFSNLFGWTLYKTSNDNSSAKKGVD